MLVTKVKICGITCAEDAVQAMHMGADIIGLNFYPPSPRYLTIEQGADVAVQLSAYVNLAGVFVNASHETIRTAIKACHLDWVQLHGDESPDFCQEFSSDEVKIMKAIRVKDEKDIETAHDYLVDAVLLDAFHPEKYGGTGLTFDWELIQRTDRRVFLAGGIHPDNAAQAVELGVYGIDVCSGIESKPGRKDHAKMQALFDNIRHLRG
jgi:phosphoribosylanthranilate isomerase